MNAIQLPFLVEGILLIAAVVLGGFLGRKGKPYGNVKLGFHLFFFLWFTMGYYFIAQGLFASPGGLGMDVSVIAMGAALAVQLATGLGMLFAKAPVSRLPKVHGTAAVLVLAADIAGFVFAGLAG